MGRVLVRSARPGGRGPDGVRRPPGRSGDRGVLDDDAPEDAAADHHGHGPQATPIAAAGAAQLATDVGDGSCDEIDTAVPAALPEQPVHRGSRFDGHEAAGPSARRTVGQHQRQHVGRDGVEPQR